MKSEQWQRDNSRIPIADHNEENYRVLNQKISKRVTLRTGMSFTSYNYNLDVKGNENPGVDKSLVLIAKQKGSANAIHAYSQVKWRVAPTLDFNAGGGITYFDMNDEVIAEPRTGITWRFKPHHAFNFAYGKHSRLEPLRFYQAKGNNGELLNPDLKITKSNHYVFSYDYRINPNLKFKLEPYYQELYDVPVIEGTSESLINYTWDMYFQDPLVNKGSGSNMGIDFTLERYMKDGYYYMLTATFFDSKYKGGDSKERNTSFNRGFVINLLGGKEWQVRQNNIFGINGKVAYMGGNRFTPADNQASQVNEMVVLDHDKAYEWQENNKLFLDIAFNYRINKAKRSHVLTLQAKNALMQSEMFGWAYDFKKQKVVEHGVTMMYPYFTYRIEF